MDHHADARLTMRVRTIKLQLPSKSTIYDIASCDEEEQTLVPTYYDLRTPGTRRGRRRRARAVCKSKCMHIDIPRKESEKRN